jgi:hypothetical protein
MRRFGRFCLLAFSVRQFFFYADPRNGFPLIKTPLPHLLNWSYGHDAPAFLSSA